MGDDTENVPPYKIVPRLFKTEPTAEGLYSWVVRCPKCKGCVVVNSDSATSAPWVNECGACIRIKEKKQWARVRKPRVGK